MAIQNTSEDNATLPSDNSELSHVLTTGENNAISTDDDTTYASVSNTAGYAIFQFENDATGKVSTTVTWDGKSDIAPSSSPVYLQIYKIAAPAAWETIDSDNATAAATDFTLTATIADLTNYKDGSGIIYCRVYQATSAGPPTLMASYSETNRNTTLNFNGLTDGAQNFQSNGKSVTSVDCYLMRINTPTGNVFARIYTSTGTPGTNATPNTLQGTSGGVDITTINDGDFELITFTFSSPVDTVNGDWYFMDIYWPNAGTGYLRAGRSNTTPFPAEIGNEAYNDGSWNAQTTLAITGWYVYGQ